MGALAKAKSPWNNITMEELRILAPIINESHDGDLEQTHKDLTLLNNMISVIKTKTLMMRKGPPLRETLKAMLHEYVTGEAPSRHGRKYVYETKHLDE